MGQAADNEGLPGLEDEHGEDDVGGDWFVIWEQICAAEAILQHRGTSSVSIFSSRYSSEFSSAKW